MASPEMGYPVPPDDEHRAEPAFSGLAAVVAEVPKTDEQAAHCDVVDAGTCTEGDFLPRLPGPADAYNIAMLAARSPAVSPAILVHQLTPRPILQVEEEMIRFAVDTAICMERQIIWDLAIGINGSMTTGGPPAAYEWLCQFIQTYKRRPQ